MAAPMAFVSVTAAGYCAIWRDALPPVAPFRPADLVIQVGREHRDGICRAAVRAWLGVERVLIGDLSAKWAAANKRAARGESPWEAVTRPPLSRAYQGDVYTGRRLPDAAIEMLTTAEALRVRELEAASDRLIAEALQGPKPLAAELLRKIDGIEASIQQVVSGAFWRRHPPIDHEERLRQLRGDAPKTSAFVVLGIAPTRDVVAIRAAWRRAALATHPDRGGNAEDFRRAREAYDAARASAGVQ